VIGFSIPKHPESTMEQLKRKRIDNEEGLGKQLWLSVE